MNPIVFRAEGRRVVRPWIPVALVRGAVVALGILIGSITSRVPG